MTNVSYPDFNHLVTGDAVEFIATWVNEGRQAHHVVKDGNNNSHAHAA